MSEKSKARPSTTAPLRIAILSSGRFHVLDLARELVRLGHDVRFYSLLPPWRTSERGLPAENARWLAPAAAVAVLRRALERSAVGEILAPLQAELIDRSAAAVLEPCDVFIGMSGMSLLTLRKAKSKYGALTYLERASRHIESQREILASSIAAGVGAGVPAWAVQRELREYSACDFVSVPAEHVRKSFLERGFPEQRLVVNNFGVHLDEFPPTEAPPADPPRLLMVGTWSYQKGADVLLEAFISLRRGMPTLELWHVGAVGDLPIPTCEGFRHFDPVSQRELSRLYAEAHVAVLASRQEGLATVQAQAIASGLHLVCTTMTGGADLGTNVRWDGAVEVVAPGEARELSEGIERALRRARALTGIRDLLGRQRMDFSWEAYARRWEARMLDDRLSAGHPAERRSESPCG